MRHRGAVSARAYRVVTPRLILRCWEPADAPQLTEAITSSLPSLRPWLPWTKAEPLPLDERIALLRRMRGNFDLDVDYVYGIFDRAGTTVLGGTGLHTRLGAGALEIGYWLRTDRLREGLCSEAVAALCRVAFALHGVDRVEIHCDPANAASAGVPRKLGFLHEATLLRRNFDAEGVLRDAMIWTLLRSSLAAMPWAADPVSAFSVTGAPLAL